MYKYIGLCIKKRISHTHTHNYTSFEFEKILCTRTSYHEYHEYKYIITGFTTYITYVHCSHGDVVLILPEAGAQCGNNTE